MAKSQVWSPQPPEADSGGAPNSCNMRRDTGRRAWLSVLTAFAKRVKTSCHWAAKTSSHNGYSTKQGALRVSARKLSYLPDVLGAQDPGVQIAWKLLTTLLPPRLQHIWRTLPWHHEAAFLEPLTEALEVHSFVYSRSQV